MSIIRIGVSRQIMVTKEDKAKFLTKFLFDIEGLTISSIYGSLLTGHTISPLCRKLGHDNKLKGACFGASSKSLAGFVSAQHIGVDIDGCIIHPRDFVRRLRIKPAFWYTTFSNKPGDYHFRLFYPLVRSINRVMEVRIIATLLNQVILFDINRCGNYESIGLDPSNQSGVQHFFGTNQNAPYFDSDYLGEKWLDPEKDLGYGENFQVSFVLDPKGWFPSYTPVKHGTYVNEIALELLNKNLIKPGDLKPEFGVGDNGKPGHAIIKSLYKHKGSTKFLQIWWHQYGEVKFRTEYPEERWNEGYWMIPDKDFIQLPYTLESQKWPDKFHRRKKLTFRTILRRFMTKNDDPDLGLYWLVYDLRTCAEHVGIDMCDLIGIIKGVYAYDFETFKLIYEEDLKKWRIKNPNPEIIFKEGLMNNTNIADYQKWCKQKRESLMLALFDKNISITENQERMAEMIHKNPQIPDSWIPGEDLLLDFTKRNFPEWKNPGKPHKPHIHDQMKIEAKQEAKRKEIKSLFSEEELEKISGRKLHGLYQERGGTLKLRKFLEYLKEIKS